MSLRNFISENIILPMSDLATGQCVHKYFKFLKGTEKWTRKQIDDYQNERLRLLIRHAVSNVPYYRDLFNRLGLKAEDIQTKADLSKIPVIDKSIMRREGMERLTAENFPKKHILYERSGGSTGEPLSYYITKESASVNLAAKLRTWYKAGYRLGDKYMKIANGKRSGKLKKIQDWLNNSIYVQFSEASDSDLKRILDLIEKEKPLFIRSYPIPLYLLAKYRLADNCNCYTFQPKCIFTTGSTLSEEYRDTIETAFSCKIIDSYSCEGNANVAECITHTCYHVTEEYGITEIVDLDENNVGKVISTDLWNFAHPFIRYNTQDLIETSQESCTCGNRHQAIKKIMGRECESIIVSGGKHFTVHDFTGYFKIFPDMNEAIDAYQIVKKKDHSIEFRLVVNKNFTPEHKETFISYWSEKFSSPVSVNVVEEIPILKNNKRLSIVEE